MLTSPPPPSFLDTYNLCHFLCTIINFLILWSFCLFLLVNFKNGLGYLTRGTVQGVYSFDGISAAGLVFKKFFVFLWYTFLISSFTTVWWFRLPIFPSSCHFLFVPSILMLYWLDSSIPSVVSLFPLFIIGIFFSTKFHPDCIFLLFVSGSSVLFFIFSNCLISFIFIRWLNFSCESINL